MGKDLSKLTEKQQDNIKELLKLIEEHPDLPIVPMVDEEVVADDCCARWMGNWGKAYIDKYIPTEDGIVFYEKGKPDTVDIFERFYDYAEVGIDEEMPDSKAIPLMREFVDALGWIEAIIIEIDLPDIELCRE